MSGYMDDYDKDWVARMLATTERTESGCAVWTRFLKRYPEASYRGKRVRVHRQMFILHQGPLAPGDCVCHSCDVPGCIEPSHLWRGTIQQNARDRAAKKRGWWERRTHCPQGHEYTEANTYLHPDTNKRSCRVCQRLRLRRKAGWPDEVAQAMPAQPKGARPINARWADLRK
jgi:hypothetical protein